MINGLTAGAAFLVSTFWDITQNHGVWTRAVADTAEHALRWIGVA